MSRVMVDNWFMEDVVKSISNNTGKYSAPYTELLMAIVLWDEVCFPKNIYNWWNSIDSQVQDRLIPIDDFEQEGLDASICRYLHDENALEVAYWRKWHCMPTSEDEIVGSGAIRYMMLSSKYGCDYLPCNDRREYFSRYLKSDEFDHLCERLVRAKAMDQDIQSYVGKIKFSDLLVEVPSLASYIVDRAIEEGMSPVDYAFHLREESSVIRYRQYLCEVITSLETGANHRYEELCRYSKEIIYDLLSLDRKKRIITIGFKLLPFPHIYFKKSNPSSASSQKVSPVEFERTIEINPHKVQLAFVKDLAMYAQRRT